MYYPIEDTIESLAWEGEGTPLNTFSSTLPNPFLAWEGEAPAEPLRIKLGRSLALPLISDGSTWERY